MKRFVLLICIYLLASAIASEILTYTDISHVIGHEFRAAEKLSKKHINRRVKRLVCGDSTGHAIFPVEHTYDSIVSLACGASISMGGQYFLLKNYLESNQDNLPEEVVLLFTPKTFGNELDKYAYQYFLKTFPIWEYKSLYTMHLYDQVQSIPLYWTAYLPFIHACGYTPVNSVPKEIDGPLMSQLSYEYLLLIDSITNVYNVPLRMYSTPVRDDMKQFADSVSEDMRVIASDRLAHLIEPYIQSIVFYPSEQFADDIHLQRAYIPHDYLGILH